MLATAPPAPKPFTLDEVVETLSTLRNLPELPEAIEQADRAALYQALGLTVRYRRIGISEQVKLTSTLKGVELERVGEPTCNFGPTPGHRGGVELERVGGGIGTRRPRWCCARSWRWKGEQPSEGRYARRPSQRTVTPSSSATRNSGSPVSTGQSSTDAAPAAKASA